MLDLEKASSHFRLAKDLLAGATDLVHRAFTVSIVNKPGNLGVRVSDI